VKRWAMAPSKWGWTRSPFLKTASRWPP
jgi:hypothetical protein